MSAAVSGWWAFMLASSLQALVLLALVALVDRLFLRKVWPELRAALWAVVLLKLVLPPTLSSPVSVAHAARDIEPVAYLAPGALVPGHGIALAALLAWAAGALVLLAWLEIGRRRVRAEWLGPASVEASGDLVARCEALSKRLGLPRAPRLRVHERGLGPGLIGTLDQVIVIPRSLVDAGPDLDHALLHELAHVKRRDAWAALACTLLRIAWWFHPAAWMATARLAELREMCCDQAVARCLGDGAGAYRGTLARLALHRVEVPAGALGFMHRHSRILARLEALERPFTGRPAWRRVITSAALAILLACAVPLMPQRPLLLGFEIPEAASLDGCLSRRYIVHGLLAAQAAAPPPALAGERQGDPR